jgi:hypothetical protein
MATVLISELTAMTRMASRHSRAPAQEGIVHQDEQVAVWRRHGSFVCQENWGQLAQQADNRTAAGRLLGEDQAATSLYTPP